MLTFFPAPYPDELLYSVFARYHMWSGNESYKGTLYDLFGKHSIRPVIDLPCGISNLLNKLAPAFHFNPEEFITKHTLFPYYAPFLPSARVAVIYRRMLKGDGLGLHMKIGITAGGICITNDLKYCPRCLSCDLKTYGEVYWHRAHQAPGVYVCPEHNVWLQTGCAECQGESGPSPIQQFRALDIVCPHGHSLINSRVVGQADGALALEQRLQELAKDINYLLSFDYRKLRLQNTLEQYLALLQNRGFATPGGRVRQRELQECFISYYGRDFLGFLESEVDISNDQNWLASAFRKPKKALHPIRHLLIMRYLTGSLSEFIRQRTKYQPFGKGPWPCLNKTADHYKKMVINKAQLTYCEDTLLPIGTFSCSCGFTYTRKGPDLTADDIYRKDTVKSFGSVWETRLIELVNEDKMSLRGLAREMDVDPRTIVRYCQKLNLKLETNYMLNCNLDMKKTFPENSLTEKESKRREFIAVLNSLETPTRSDLRKANYSTYTWLYRHDREWLERVLPPPIARGYRNRRNRDRVDWEQRDEEISDKLIQAYQRLVHAEKPVFLSKTRLGREIGEIAELDHNIHKLPKSAKTLKALTESIEEYQIRRVEWATSKLIEIGQKPVEWRVIRIAGLRPEFAKIVKNRNGSSVFQKETEH